MVQLSVGEAPLFLFAILKEGVGEPVRLISGSALKECYQGAGLIYHLSTPLMLSDD